MAIMKNFAPTDCTTEATELGEPGLLATGPGVNDAGAAANILDVPVLKTNFPQMLLVKTVPRMKGRNGIRAGIAVG